MNPIAKLLIIDDDVELAELLQEYLQGENFEVGLAHDGRAGIDKVKSDQWDLVILDVMMPELNGFDVLRQMRESLNVPVLMLTAKGDDIDRILGLEMGADDYMPKPCNPRELVARVRAILRRADIQKKPIEVAVVKPLELGELVVDGRSRSVNYAHEACNFTGAEYTVLEILAKSAGEIVSKEALTEQALGRKLTPYDRSIDVHVSNIRKKLTSHGAPKELIINVRGAGYMLTLPEAE